MKINDIEIHHSNSVLDFNIISAKRIHSNLVENGKIKGDWDDFQWIYLGRVVKFSEIEFKVSERSSTKKIVRTKKQLKGNLAQLARCYIIHMTKNNLSSALCLNRFIVFQFLYDFLDGSFNELVNITPFQLDNAITKIKTIYSNEKSIYARANDLRYLIRYLCSLKSFDKKGSKSLIIKPFEWDHFLKNAINDNASLKVSDDNKYPYELDIAIGKLKRSFLENPSIEPKSGFDSIRLNVLVFALSMGLRLGELTRLSINAIDKEDRTSANFLRVWTEKGALPIARPIPKLWEAPLIKAYEELLIQCAEARKCALEIENNGFQFITDYLQNNSGLTKEDKIYLISKRLSIDDFCTVDAITNRFDIEGKRFDQGCRYSRCVTFRPSNYRVLIKDWIAQYIKNLKNGLSVIDAFGHLISTGGKAPKGTAPLKRLIQDLTGKKNYPPPNWKWFFIGFSSLIENIVSAAKAKEDEAQLKSTVYKWWDSICPKFDDTSSSSEQCIRIINYKKWTLMLKEEYASDLQRHYRENCDAEIFETDRFDYIVRSNAFEESIPLSKHLIVTWEHQFRSCSNRLGILPKPLTSSDIYNWLSKASGKTTVFERYNVRDANGKVYSYSPHQIRHWVTTAFLRSGPNEMLIDLWMGRNPGQLRNYDHRTSKERAEYVRAKGLYLSQIPPSDWLGKRVSAMRGSNIPESEIADFIDRKLQILHFTPWGYCSRSLTIMPCERGMMCLKGFGGGNGCTYFHIDPTDIEAKHKIQQMLSNYRSNLIVLEPRYLSLKDKFHDELDDTQVMDQHLIHIIQMIKGCEQALRAYDQIDSAKDPNMTAVRVFHHENQK